MTLSACGSSRVYETDARTVLREAKAVVDSSPAIHFTLQSRNTGGASTYITGGEGDAVRPDRISGSLDVVVSGLPLHIGIASAAGTFYVKLPFTTHFVTADPAKYGFADPAKLFDPSTGLTTVLGAAKHAAMTDRDRLGGEELYEIDVTLPGDLVKQLLASADPSKDVTGRVGVDVDNHQVRRVVLTGPFFSVTQQSTYTVTLDRYGESVQVTVPPTP